MKQAFPFLILHFDMAVQVTQSLKKQSNLLRLLLIYQKKDLGQPCFATRILLF